VTGSRQSELPAADPNPGILIGIPAPPKVKYAVLFVAILIIPLLFAPAPASILTLPPVLVPDPAVADPPVINTAPPVAAVVPDSLPAVSIKFPPVPVVAVLTTGSSVKELPSIKVVMSGLLFPASFITPFSTKAIFVSPFVCREIRVLVAGLVSLIIMALAVAWLVIKNFESVVVSARINEISLLSLVVIVLPKSYADCKVELPDPAPHFIRLSDPSIQILEPIDVDKLAIFTVLVVERLVVETPVAPVIAPTPEILIDGEVRKLENPVPKVIALKVLLV
jgi:hypothetical protein